jgi:hypothetical protein
MPYQPLPHGAWLQFWALVVIVVMAMGAALYMFLKWAGHDPGIFLL